MPAYSLSTLRKFRTAERKHLKKLMDQTAAYQGTPTVQLNRMHLKELLAQTESRQNRISELDSQILSHNDFPEDEVDREVSECDQYSSAAIDIASRLKSWLSELTPMPATPLAVQGHDTPTTMPSTIALDTTPEVFDGDRLRYRAFMVQFNNWISKRPAATDLDRLIALRKFLRGAPKLLVDSLAVNDVNFAVALKLLETNFGQVDVERQQILASLSRLPKVHSHSDTAGLRHLLNSVQSSVQTLEGLGSPLHTFALSFSATLRGALPQKLVFEFCEMRRLSSMAKAAPGPNQLGEEAKPAGVDKFAAEAAQEIKDLVAYISRYTAHREQASFLSHGEGGDEHAKPHAPKPLPKGISKGFGKSPGKGKSTVAAAAHAQPKFAPCLFCKDSAHSSSRCSASMSIEQRLKILNEQKRCRICFRNRHADMSMCKGPCVPCKTCGSKQHYTSMHTDDQDAAAHAVAAAHDSRAPDADKHALVFTASAYLVHQGTRTLVRIFLDPGSTLTFVSPETLATLNGVIPLHYAQLKIEAFSSTHKVNTSRHKLTLENVADGERLDIFAYKHAFSVNPSNACPPDTLESIKLFAQSHQLADKALLGSAPATAPALLVGMDQYYKIAHVGREKVICDGIVAKHTRLGWIVGGSSTTKNIQAEVASVVTHCCAASLSKPASALKRLWELEELGIKNEPARDLSADDESAVCQFRDSVHFDGAMYTVSLPRRDTLAQLHNNKSIAMRRLAGKLKSLSRDKSTYERYDTEIMSFVADGFAEEVFDVDLDDADSADGSYYMPHHQVISQINGHARWRIVFDCSSAAPGKSSLNAHLLPGPNLNPDLVKLLMNFRLHSVAVCADIKKAYMQIGIVKQDRPFFRFLWQGPHDNSIRTFQMKRVTWGAASSGFLLAATLREHLKRVDPNSIYKFGDSLYHDDFLRSFTSADEAITAIKLLTSWLGSANMQLAKWKTNSLAVTEHLQINGVEPAALNIEEATVFKVLGLTWSPARDEFCFLLADVAEKALTLSAPTKRDILRIVASVFDPLGWLIPYVLRGKLLVQGMWTTKLQWDQAAPTAIAAEFRRWTGELRELMDVKVARRYLAHQGGQVAYHLHVFGDASEGAYAAVAYLQSCQASGTGDCSLVMAKSRLAPRDHTSLPRLELLAAMLAIRLKQYVIEALAIEVTQVSFYTDATIVYHWCTSSNAGRWKTFVANRVAEIQKNSSPSQWYIVPGRLNIADFATRGVSASELVGRSEWWRGPRWLQMPRERQPISQPRLNPTDVALAPNNPELRQTACSIVSAAATIIDLERHSSLERALRILANVLRFTYIARRLDVPPEVDLLLMAERILMRCTQQQYFAKEIAATLAGDRVHSASKLGSFELFVDDNHLLRARTRLTQGTHLTYDEKNPIVIPGESRLATLLILRQHRINAHFGLATILSTLRRRFWVTRARQVIKNLLRKCITCRKLRGPVAGQVQAPLPPSRVTLANVFSTTGVDFCGPFYTRLKDTTTKNYIALFTCAATRAIHLELVPSMVTPQTHLAIRRFISLYPACRRIVSDNGRSFVKAATEIKKIFNSNKDPRTRELLSSHRIEWEFICPRAPWHGGFYERLIGSVKSALAKTLGRSLITFEELRTIICELAAIINDRPLTYETGDPEGPRALTPGHFIRGGLPVSALCSTIPLDELGPNGSPNGDDFREAYRMKTSYFKALSVRWYREYLVQLRSANLARSGEPRPIKVGDVCLLKDDNSPRIRWDLVRVLELHPGRDGAVRTYTIKFANGNTSRRAAQLLYPLEVA